MSKEWFELTLTPLQPLHIGLGNYGVVASTHIFIPGKTMWGGVTGRLGVFLDMDEKEFRKSGLDPFAEISNFYPTIEGKIQLPRYDHGEFCLGNYTENEFRHYFTDTFVSTGTTGETRSAADESLHEIECLLPESKEQKPKSVQWKGILRIDMDTDLPGNMGKMYDFFKGMSQFHIGGERKYGFGLMEMSKTEKLKNPSDWNLKDPEQSVFDISNEPTVHFVDYNVEGIIKGTTEIWMETEKILGKDIFFHRRRIVYQPGCEGIVSGLRLYKGIIGIDIE